jgi:hypothetical protein
MKVGSGGGCPCRPIKERKKEKRKMPSKKYKVSISILNNTLFSIA